MADSIWVPSVLNGGPISVSDSVGSAPRSGATVGGGRRTTASTHGADGGSTPILARQESMQKLREAIAVVELHITTIEGDIEYVQQALVSGGMYKGKGGDALVKEEERLVRKEYQLRDKEKSLRDEKVALLRSNTYGVPEVPQKRVSFVMTSAHVGDPSGEQEEQQRLSQVHQIIDKRRRSGSGRVVSDLAGNDTVANVYKLEEDPRLLIRIAAFNMPILVSTLLAGFTLVLFDVAETELAQQLAVLSFGLELSASVVLSLVSFQGQQLYSHATDVKPLTRKFLFRMCSITVFALVEFALGLIVFVVSFAVEATQDFGAPWMAIIGLVFCPTLVAAILFVTSTVEARRRSMPLPEPE